MTTVTVIIASHNASKTIGRAINSALNQTMRLVDVLVVDDNSTDATKAIVAGFAAANQRVRQIACDGNLGPGFARNLAIAEAKGEWIAILDADDAIDPDRVRRLIELADVTRSDLVSDNLALYRPDGAATGEAMFPPTWLQSAVPLSAEAFVLGNIGVRGTARLAYGFMKPIVKKKFLEKNRLRYELSRFAEDYLLALQCLLSGGVWHTLPEPLYHYTVSCDTLTTKRSESDLLALIEAERALLTNHSVDSNVALRRAVLRHLLSTERAVVWNAFAQSLKHSDLKAAINCGMSHPRFALHLANETSWLAWRRLEEAINNVFR